MYVYKCVFGIDRWQNGFSHNSLEYPSVLLYCLRYICPFDLFAVITEYQCNATKQHTATKKDKHFTEMRTKKWKATFGDAFFFFSRFLILSVVFFFSRCFHFASFCVHPSFPIECLFSSISEQTVSVRRMILIDIYAQMNEHICFESILNRHNHHAHLAIMFRNLGFVFFAWPAAYALSKSEQVFLAIGSLSKYWPNVLNSVEAFRNLLIYTFKVMLQINRTIKQMTQWTWNNGYVMAFS